MLHGPRNVAGRLDWGLEMKDQGWDIAGDETILLQNNLGTIPIYVSKNKFDAANHLYNEKNCEIVIMDDAFQHRKI